MAAMNGSRLTYSDAKPARKYSEMRPPSIPHPDDIEAVTIAPSTELIPDEYEHEDNGRGLVLIFYCLRDSDNMKIMRQTLIDQKYLVPDENVHKLANRKQVLDALKYEAQKNHNDKSCLLLIFMGNSERENQFLLDSETSKNAVISVKDVWEQFTGDKCESFRNKPKIFLFQASKKMQTMEFDSIEKYYGPIKKPYDVPAEADMMLIYKRTESTTRTQFIVDFCSNIANFGQKDDVIDLVTRTGHRHEKRPLIISTLTRKFFVRQSNQRGYHFDLHETQEFVHELLQNLHEKLNLVQEQKAARKRQQFDLTVTDGYQADNGGGSFNQRKLNGNARSNQDLYKGKKTTAATAKKAPWKY